LLWRAHATKSACAGLDAFVTTLDFNSLGAIVCSTAVASNGIRFVCTQIALLTITICGVRALLAGHRTEGGFEDGSEALNCPLGITVDGDGNLLVSDTRIHSLRKVTPSGAVLTQGFAEGVGAAVRSNHSETKLLVRCGEVGLRCRQDFCAHHAKIFPTESYAAGYFVLKKS